MRKDVQDIFRATPHSKQVMMFSATLSKEIRPVCKKFMQNVSQKLLLYHTDILYKHVYTYTHTRAYFLSPSLFLSLFWSAVLCTATVECGSGSKRN